VFLDIFEHFFADQALAVHGFVRRDVLFQAPSAETLESARQFFFAAGGPPMF